MLLRDIPPGYSALGYMHLFVGHYTSGAAVKPWYS